MKKKYISGTHTILIEAIDDIPQKFILDYFIVFIKNNGLYNTIIFHVTEFLDLLHSIPKKKFESSF